MAIFIVAVFFFVPHLVKSRFMAQKKDDYCCPYINWLQSPRHSRTKVSWPVCTLMRRQWCCVGCVASKSNDNLTRVWSLADRTKVPGENWVGFSEIGQTEELLRLAQGRRSEAKPGGRIWGACQQQAGRGEICRSKLCLSIFLHC